MKIHLKLLLILGLSLIFTTQSSASQKVKWKLAMTWPKTLTPLSTVPLRVSALVKEMSGGDFTIKVHGKGIHKAPLGVLDMVKNNIYEMGHSSSYYYKGEDIATALLTTAPFGMTTAEQHAWYYYGGGESLTKKVYDKFNVDVYLGGNTGVQMGGWFRKEINTVDDLKGLKMRIPGMAGEVFSKLGVNVTNIPAGELYTSLDRGTIDAVEFVSPSLDIKMGFHKIAPYYYTGWHEPASEMHFFINQKAFKELPQEYQSILKTAMKVATAEMYIDNYNLNVIAWEQMKKEFPNIKVKTFPKKVLQDMKVSSDKVMEKYSQENKLFKEIYQSQQNYLKKARVWTTISEYDYISTSNSVK
ncbi:MAG: TRAP-type mannitol/chloroaromatic compound transport system substrate-binding protein [Arcobacteraceae bacterium]|jgi:TRAP-type mannitol/chloroaromatic compound transport system substrate-binding protein